MGSPCNIVSYKRIPDSLAISAPVYFIITILRVEEYLPDFMR